MLPSITNIANTDDLVLDFETEVQEKTKTFGMNEDTRIANDTNILYCIGGKIDGLDALKQNIFIMLSVEADQHIIYPYTYGIQTLDLIGKPSYYVMALIPERIKATLLTDDRITDVTDFEFEVNANKLNVKFVVHTIYGEMEEETVVIY